MIYSNNKYQNFYILQRILMYQRYLKSKIETALKDTPVVLVVGARQAGKSTLVKAIGQGLRPYVSLDNQGTLELARFDPGALVQGMNSITIDEVQRAPELILAIKKSVDEDRRPGRFLLTGSSNILTLPKVADSLAGRVEIFYLYPLARSEIIGNNSSFLSRLIDKEFVSGTCSYPVVGNDLVKIVLSGGFPEAVNRTDFIRKNAWFKNYLISVIKKDLRDVVNTRIDSKLSGFLKSIGVYSGQVINYSQIGNNLDLSYKTVQHYIYLFEQIFLIFQLRPWYNNQLKRLVKKPKVYLIDSGIHGFLRNYSIDRLCLDRQLFGTVLEGFVLSEVIKLISFSFLSFDCCFLNQNNRFEVDMVLESNDGKLYAIEVKAQSEISLKAFTGLKKLESVVGDRFIHGVVLYDGKDIISYGDKLSLVPISCLWQ